MVQVALRRYPLPWDNNKSAGMPFKLFRWWANLDTGTFCRMDFIIRKERDEETRQFRNVASEALNKLKGFVVELDMADLERIYQISATRDIGLFDAMVIHKGESFFPPDYLERVKTVPCYKALEKYAVEEERPEPAPVVKKKAAKKKARKKREAKTSEMEDILNERLGDPEE